MPSGATRLVMLFCPEAGGRGQCRPRNRVDQRALAATAPPPHPATITNVAVPPPDDNFPPSVPLLLKPKNISDNKYDCLIGTD
jgi:hypothetical protein